MLKAKNNFCKKCVNKMETAKFILVAVSFFLLFSLPTHAQTSALRLTTSPLPINLKTAPGSSVSATLKVKNDGLNTEKLQVELMKFKADEQTGAPILINREAGDDYFDWVTFSEKSFTLPPNEWKTLTANFQVPPEASFGYYYAIVFSRAEEKTDKIERQTFIAGGAATLVLLEVDVPGAKKEAQITSFSADKKMYEFLPVNFTVKMKNTGNVHLAPRGNIFISHAGKEAATLEVNLNKGSILPNSPRNFQSKWEDGFPVFVEKVKDGQPVLDEKGNHQYELKWDFSQASKLRFGKYTAKLIMVYDNGQRDVPLEAQISFWVVPWRLLAGALVILIFVLIGFKSTLQNIWKKIKKIFRKE